MNGNKFENIDDLHNELTIMGNEFDISYKGGEYFISCGSFNGGKKKFYASNTNNAEEESFEYDTFDEMLDNFKAADGKSLREFLLDTEIESCAF
jgi:hypothetical protein